MRDIVPIVEGLAKALDRDDFDAASCFLSEDCVYDTGGEVVTGRIAIIDAYRAASTWAHATFDEVVYESEIDRASVSDASVAVIYTDRIRKGERWHTHNCRQTVDVDRRSGKVVAIAHGDLEGEAERLNAFFAACGIVRLARAEN
jgi:hypothetical protein